MIWSLIKVLLFVAIVAALALGAGYLTDSAEGIRIAAAGYEFTLGPLQAVIDTAQRMLAGVRWRWSGWWCGWWAFWWPSCAF